jgi:lysophospholipase L1-like esterase
MKTKGSRFVFLLVCAAGAGAAYWYWWRPAPIVNPHPGGTRVMALGDSLTSGVGASSGHDYVSVLTSKIGRPIVNCGVAGDATADALARLNRDVLTRDPKIVIVFLGGNDFLQRVPADRTFANLDQIVRQVQARGALVVLVEVRPPLAGWQYGRRFKRLARARGAVLVPKVFRGIFLDPTMKSDEIHFNDRGYAVVAERIHTAIKPYLN